MAYWIPLAMMAGGMLKSELVDKPAAQEERRKTAEIEATKTRFAPFTGQYGDVGKAMGVKQPSTLQAGIDYGLVGLALQQGMQDDMNKKAATAAAASSGAPSAGASSGGNFIPLSKNPYQSQYYAQQPQQPDFYGRYFKPNYGLTD